MVDIFIDGPTSLVYKVRYDGKVRSSYQLPDRTWLTQNDLAKTLDVTSVTVSRWETGARKISDSLLPAVSKKLGISKRALRPDLAELIGDAA